MVVFRCPRCGKGELYQGLLSIADQCTECGLSLKSYQQGDGPASLSILIVGALAGVFASVLEVKVGPPLWVHLVIWPPLVFVASIFCLRWLKAMMIEMQYRHRPDEPGA